MSTPTHTPGPITPAQEIDLLKAQLGGYALREKLLEASIEKLRGAVDRLRNCPDLSLDSLEPKTLEALDEAKEIMQETTP